MGDFTGWTTWIPALVWTIGTVAVSWGAGLVLGAILATRLPRWLPDRHEALSKTTARTLRARLPWWCLLVGIWIAAGYWPITPMLTALGVGGLAVALALQEPLANFFAGVFLTLGGQIRLGDYVKLDSGQEGYVADFSWRSTRLRMLPTNLVVVPNARLAQAIVHTFADSSVNFTVVLRAAEFVDQYLIKHEFIKRLHARFDRERITIPFPIRTLANRATPL